MHAQLVVFAVGTILATISSILLADADAPAVLNAVKDSWGLWPALTLLLVLSLLWGLYKIVLYIGSTQTQLIDHVTKRLDVNTVALGRCREAFNNCAGTGASGVEWDSDEMGDDAEVTPGGSVRAVERVRRRREKRERGEGREVA